MTFPPDSHSTTDFSGRLDAFESKFRNGETPLLEQHLPEPGPNQEPHILQLALIDLEMRLRRGENLSAKSYLDRFPNLTNLGKPLLELIQTEVHWKERRGETIDAELLTRQFPSLAGEILAFLRFRGTLPPEIPGFRNLELVGKGGMGVVYKAMETRLNRDVALKVIRPDRATDPDSLELFQQRFQIEAEKMAAVNHPHVIQVFHAGKVGPQVYLAMEYVAGETLQAKIKRDGTLPFREAAGIVEKIALGVAAVHVTGTIHRDLKPDNVLISTKGIPKVADFGLARQIEPTNGATQEGIFRGTPEYASPEQASMGALDLTERTDVYGLGAILYACLTGRAPFPSDSLPLVLRKVLKDSVIPINSLRPDCPRDLETICNKCLEKESVRRYSSALELAEDLRRHLDGRPIEARPVGSIEKTWLWAKRNQALAASLSVIAAVLVGSAIGFASLSLWALKEKDRANDETTRATNNEALAKTNAETANKNYQEAEKEKKRAQDQRTIAEDNAYISSIQQAKAEWDHGDPSVAQTTLGLIPFAKRGWEHHFLTTLFRSNHANLWHQDERRCVCFSPDRIHLASGGADGSIKLWNMKTGMELLILAHSQPISGLSFSPDGKFLASSSFDQTIRLVDPFNGQEISVLKHAAPVLSFSFGKDGKQLASSSLDQSLTLWSLPQGKSIRQFKSQSGPIRSIEISPNGKYLAGAGQDSTLKLWDLETSKEIRTLKGHTKEVACVTFHPEGNTLASASEDHTVKLWDVNSGSMLLNISGHSAPVNGLKFSPDGMWLASASQDLTLKVWDRRSGQERRTFKGHTEQVHAVAFHPTGTILASASQDQTVKVWDFTSQSDLLHWKGHSREIQCVRYSPDGKWLASAGRDGLVKIWDTTKGQLIRALKGHTGPVVSTTFFPDGNRLASSSDDNTVKIWDVSRGTVIKTITGHSQMVHWVSVSPNGKQLATAGEDNTLRLWDAETGSEIHSIKGHKALFSGIEFDMEGNQLSTSNHATPLPVYCVIFSPDGQQLISSGADRKVRYWDAKTGTELRPPTEYPSRVTSLCFSPDGTHLVSTAGDGTVRISDAKTGQEVKILKGHKYTVNSVSLNREGTRLATGSSDRTIKLWDTSTGKEILTLKGHTDSVSSICFRPDGAQLASAGNDQSLILWDATIELESVNLKGHQGEVRDAVFSPDGTQIASASNDRTVKLWDLESGQEFQTMKGNRDFVTGVRFSPDGSMLASAGWDHTVWIWNRATGEKIHTLLEHPSFVTSLNFSPNGNLLASSSFPGIIKVWDTKSGKSCFTFTLPLGQTVKNLNFSPDGTVLSAFIPGRPGRFWNMIQGQAVEGANFENPEDWGPQNLDRSPDGKWLVSPERDTIRITKNALLTKVLDSERVRLGQWLKPNPTWHLLQAQEAKLGGQPFAAAFHGSLARQSGSGDLGLSLTLWKNLRECPPSPARDQLVNQTLAEDVVHLMFAGTQATLGNWLGALSPHP